jgi:hypothetical protein
MAREAFKKADKSRATELLYYTKNMALDIKDENLRGSMLLGVATVYAQFDVLEAGNVLRSAITAFNRASEPNLDKFSIPRRVNFTCQHGDQQWYGGSEEAEKYSLSETLSAIARSDAQAALSIARGFDDAGTRIRAQLSIIRAMSSERQHVRRTSYRQALPDQ